MRRAGYCLSSTFSCSNKFAVGVAELETCRASGERTKTNAQSQAEARLVVVDTATQQQPKVFAEASPNLVEASTVLVEASPNVVEASLNVSRYRRISSKPDQVWSEKRPTPSRRKPKLLQIRSKPAQSSPTPRQAWSNSAQNSSQVARIKPAQF